MARKENLREKEKKDGKKLNGYYICEEVKEGNHVILFFLLPFHFSQIY